MLPFLRTYRVGEIDYAVLSSYVAHKLEQNEEIDQAKEAGIALRDRYGKARRTLSPRTINMTLQINLADPRRRPQARDRDDQPGGRTIACAERARELRREGLTWKEIAAEMVASILR